MAGYVTFHKASTMVDNQLVPVVGAVSGGEAITSLPTTTTIEAEAGDIASVWYDAAVVVRIHKSGEAAPTHGHKIPAGFVERFKVVTGDVVKLAAT